MRHLIFIALLIAASVSAQSPTTDIYVMPGSDFKRPGLLPRSNLNIGVGYTIKNNEYTASYTYENAGSHGFWNGNRGSHTEAIGLMRSISIGKTPWGMYGWQQGGLTSITNGPTGVQNRAYFGSSAGVMYHVTPRHGFWFQETYNKVSTIPWYTSTNIGYVFSF